MLSVAQTLCLLYLLVCVGKVSGTSVSGRVDATQCHANASSVDDSGTEPLCICLQGFKGNGLDCDDIDECATMEDACQHGQCRNFAGGYWCECNQGYAPNEDKKQCQEVKCEDIYNKTVCETRADNKRCESHPDDMKQCKKSCNTCNGAITCTRIGIESQNILFRNTLRGREQISNVPSLGISRQMPRFSPDMDVYQL
ncbi:hypothetical protein ScPMuIL_008442 [Solemya velum]